MPVQNKPIIHGRDHETDGADPIRGLLPAVGGDFEGVVRATSGLLAYWRLGETGEPWQDSSGYGPAQVPAQPAADLTLEGPGTALTPNVTGAMPASFDDGAVEFNYDGAAATGGTWLEYGPSARFDLDEMTVACWVKAKASASARKGVIVGNTVRTASQTQGWGLHIVYPGRSIRFSRGDPPSAGTERFVASTGGLETDRWYFLVGSYDLVNLKLYIDAALVGETADGFTAPVGVSGGVKIGQGSFYEDITWAWYYGLVDEAAVWDRALTQAEINQLYQAGLGSGGGAPGWVVTPDPDTGDPVWRPPGLEVEHGDGEEDETPVTSPGPGAGPVNANGWHYLDHFEYVVLYDSNPGRFDVPSRKWVRVPFNTVRIQRRWELESGYCTDAWLPDDRGLSEHAKNGTLLVTPGMTFSGGPLDTEQEISGWYSVEYPMLDWTELPNYPPGEESSPDHYARGARMTNTTSGQVLRAGAALPDHPSWRVFFDWPFFTPASGDEGIWFVNADNPYPYYPIWAGRPLNKPLPYPKFSNTESLDSYQTSAGNPGFDLESMVSRTFLEAGAALSLQAWQDTPWPLRFGTDKYPPYTPQDYVQKWRKRPCLLVRHYYDPDTVDHETGALL